MIALPSLNKNYCQKLARLFYCPPFIITDQILVRYSCSYFLSFCVKMLVVMLIDISSELMMHKHREEHSFSSGPAVAVVGLCQLIIQSSYFLVVTSSSFLHTLYSLHTAFLHGWA